MANSPNLVPVVVLSDRQIRAQLPALVDGCTNPGAIADYMRATNFEYQVKGFGIGVFIGAAACVALALYMRSKGA